MNQPCSDGVSPSGNGSRRAHPLVSEVNLVSISWQCGRPRRSVLCGQFPHPRRSLNRPTQPAERAGRPGDTPDRSGCPRDYIGQDQLSDRHTPDRTGCSRNTPGRTGSVVRDKYTRTGPVVRETHPDGQDRLSEINTPGQERLSERNTPGQDRLSERHTPGQDWVSKRHTPGQDRSAEPKDRPLDSCCLCHIPAHLELSLILLCR